MGGAELHHGTCAALKEAPHLTGVEKCAGGQPRVHCHLLSLLHQPEQVMKKRYYVLEFHISGILRHNKEVPNAKEEYRENS